MFFFSFFFCISLKYEDYKQMLACQDVKLSARVNQWLFWYATWRRNDIRIL